MIVTEYWPNFVDLDREPRVREVDGLDQVPDIDFIKERSDGQPVTVKPDGKDRFLVTRENDPWVIAIVRAA